MHLLYNIKRILETILLDKKWYLNTYEDVKEAHINPRYHYFFYGFFENRFPRKNKKLVKVLNRENIISQIPTNIPDRNLLLFTLQDFKLNNFKHVPIKK